MENLTDGLTAGLFERPIKLNETSPLGLAFVGDGVYELMVREYLLRNGNSPVRKLNAKKVSLVCCEAQAKALALLLPGLSPAETEICLRGRNAHVNHVPKNANIADYHSATALECLFGYLYLQGNFARLGALFEEIVRGTLPAV